MDSLALIYAAVPRLNCKGRCQASCGPIDASAFEKAEFKKQTGKRFPDFSAMLHSGKLECPHLNVIGQCDVYQNRPLICRLWGVVDVPQMRCPYGCAPDHWLSDAEAKGLLRAARNLPLRAVKSGLK